MSHQTKDNGFLVCKGFLYLWWVGNSSLYSRNSLVLFTSNSSEDFLLLSQREFGNELPLNFDETFTKLKRQITARAAAKINKTLKDYAQTCY